jgi:hypothetical protein
MSAPSLSVIEERVMATTHVSTSAAIRARVNHLFIDSDGHPVGEERVVTDRDFRDVIFVNAVTLCTGMNPDFFTGTVVETAVETLRAQGIA